MASESPKRILIVDDDPELLVLVRMLLARINVQMLTADSAVAAAQLLRTPPLPDALILDLMLPDASGTDFLRSLRSRETFKNLPVLVLSSVVDPMAIRAALDAGADRYVIKPYIANTLISTVQDILSTGRQRR
jgi:DNA-binding response OmpR family regulator